jgi:hypothetical protein
MSPMGDGKRIIYIDLCQPGQFLGKNGIVFSFFLVKTQVFQHQYIPGTQPTGLLLDLRADTVAAHLHAATE